MKQQWVVGFMFDLSAGCVVLIRKARPAWQAGKLNGVGGKVEPGEPLNVAMSREFLEETDIDTTPALWDRFAALTWEEGVVHFFRSFVPEVFVRGTRSMTDEQVCVYGTNCLPASVVPNLRWLVPLAAYRHDTYDVIDIVETGSTLPKPGRLEVFGG